MWPPQTGAVKEGSGVVAGTGWSLGNGAEGGAVADARGTAGSRCGKGPGAGVPGEAGRRLSQVMALEPALGLALV